MSLRSTYRWKCGAPRTAVITGSRWTRDLIPARAMCAVTPPTRTAPP